MDQENYSVAPDTSHEHRPQQPSPGQPTHTQRRRRGRRKWMVIAIVAAFLLAGASGGFWFYKQSRVIVMPASNGRPAASAESMPVTRSLITERQGDNAAVGTTAYISTQANLNLSFEYPDGWTVSPKQTAASATTPIIVTSPASVVTEAGGGTASGRVVVTIRPGGGQVAELVAATAAQDSVQMAYKKPTASQRQYPFLTFVHFAAGSKAPGAFEEVMITGGQQFKKTDAITSDSLSTIDPLITAGFYRCPASGADCTVQGSPDLGVSNADWQGGKLFLQTAEILASFKLN